MPFIPLHDKNPRVLVSQPWITWLLILANIYFGTDASLTAGVATRAAELLMGAGL